MPNEEKSSCVATPDVLAILLISPNPLTKDSKLPII